MNLTVKKNNQTLLVELREKITEHLEVINYECPVDLDQSGEVIGLEIEAPRQIFGSEALKGIEFIDLTGVKPLTTPEGLTISPHAITRPPVQNRDGFWISYETKYDMLYICLVPDVSKRSYEISIPVECNFFLDQNARLQKIEIPLDEVYKEYREIKKQK